MITCNREANVPEVVAHFGWIPEAMLHSLCRKDAPLELRSVAFIIN